ncbi:hypothetical protein DRF62_17310 [Chryseobacterium piscium]|uniref:Uncharacterized protein n=1 Tax=Chryseobacterium piscium TaxID=333702 RepID=A0A3D9BCY5_9FLAO|nr:hypothetical protein [Chryseobacterium piscium]REC51464.1 hypothetical protein DRF62_17310 [Chryseobacterium piscium]
MLVSEFFNKELNSLKFYKDIDESSIIDDLQWISELSYNCENLYSLKNIDFLTYVLLLNYTDKIKSDISDFTLLAKKYSQKYFELINTEDSNTELKLKCQRLNYLLQIYLDKDKPKNQLVLHLDDIAYFYPWDIEILNDDLVIVVESRDTVRVNNKVVGELSNRNMMITQVDKYDNYLVFNSCYSSYSVTLEISADQYNVDEDDNCLFIFYYKGLLSKVTSLGKIIVNDIQIGELGELNKAWRFRLIDNSLFVFDWLKFGSCVIFDMVSGLKRRHVFDEMWIPHDVVGCNDHFYFIDKQQGMIFKYDSEFYFVDSFLNFGYGKGELCDPIGIKNIGNNMIAVSSWLSGKINVINL